MSEVIFDMGHCDGCAIAHKCEIQIRKNYDEASYILEAMQSDALIKLENIKYEKEEQEATAASRREFFSKANLKGVIKTKHAFEKVYMPTFIQLVNKLKELSVEWKDIPMLARTHGQPASPTRLGKEILVFVVVVESMARK